MTSSTVSNPVWDQSIVTDSGKSPDNRYWSLFTTGIRVALFVHIGFIVLFFQMQSQFMAMVNVGSVFIYLGCLHLLQKEKRNLIVPLCCFEIIAHTLLAVREIGWDSGFHYYLLAFIPMIFASTNRKTVLKILMQILICSSYILMDALLSEVPPVIQVDDFLISIIRFTNVTVSFFFLGLVAFLYIDVVNRQHKHLTLLATTDILTGMYNRRHMMLLINRYKKQYEETQQGFSLILADIDNFKMINDTYGHDVGDKILIEVGSRLKQSLWGQDIICRWGGEEFLALLPDTSLMNASHVAMRINKTIADSAFHINEEPLQVNLSMGVSEYLHDEEPDKTIQRADAGLYEAKNSGKNKVVASAYNEK